MTRACKLEPCLEVGVHSEDDDMAQPKTCARDGGSSDLLVAHAFESQDGSFSPIFIDVSLGAAGT